LVSGIVSGVVGTIILVVRLAGGGDIPGVTPEQMQQLERLTEGGMNPTMFALFAIPSLLCITSIGAGLAAAGGAIYAAIRPD
jgi:hypothetical protein